MQTTVIAAQHCDASALMSSSLCAAPGRGIVKTVVNPNIPETVEHLIPQ